MPRHNEVAKPLNDHCGVELATSLLPCMHGSNSCSTDPNPYTPKTLGVNELATFRRSFSPESPFSFPPYPTAGFPYSEFPPPPASLPGTNYKPKTCAVLPPATIFSPRSPTASQPRHPDCSHYRQCHKLNEVLNFNTCMYCLYHVQIYTYKLPCGLVKVGQCSVVPERRHTADKGKRKPVEEKREGQGRSGGYQTAVGGHSLERRHTADKGKRKPVGEGRYVHGSTGGDQTTVGGHSRHTAEKGKRKPVGERERAVVVVARQPLVDIALRDGKQQTRERSSQ